MCHLFQCDASLSRLAEVYAAAPGQSCESARDIDSGSLTAGMLANEAGDRELYSMQLGIAPPHSESPVHPTFDHRLASIEEPTKWPWLSAIETSRCVVPTSSFHIHSYWGDPEGTEIVFRRADGQLLHAAGVYRVWHSPTGEQQLHTMSLLMRPASDYVMDHGSDRQPIFLAECGIDAWIDLHTVPCERAIQVLRHGNVDPDLTHHHHRDLPAGWRKHQKQKTRRRGQTMAAQDRCAYECGF